MVFLKILNFLKFLRWTKWNLKCLCNTFYTNFRFNLSLACIGRSWHLNFSNYNKAISKQKFLFDDLITEVAINDVVFKAQDELSCNLGECVSVGVRLTNAFENPLKNLILSISLYQDHYNGVSNYRLDARVCIAGANKVMLPTVSYCFCKFFQFFKHLLKFLVKRVWSSISRVPNSISYCGSI